MPIFEYTCKKCGHDFEEVVIGSATVRCPKCDTDKTEKLLSCCSFKTGGAVSGGSSLGQASAAPSGGG